MKVTQLDERTFKTELNDAELDDLTHEASYSEISLLNVMRAIFYMTFVQVTSCRYFRRMLSPKDKDKPKTAQEKFRRGVEQGG